MLLQAHDVQTRLFEVGLEIGSSGLSESKLRISRLGVSPGSPEETAANAVRLIGSNPNPWL
jgi:hypothetical protein